MTQRRRGAEVRRDNIEKPSVLLRVSASLRQVYLLPVLLLAVLLGGVWLVLLARGLDLGYTGDLLDYAYHYERLGTFGGARWLVTEHLQRHILAPLVSAPLAYLFPNNSAAWYAYAFLMHYVNAVMAYVLANTVLRGRYRWLSLAAALVFAFHMLHLRDDFEFPTNGHRNTALFTSLVSLWLFLQYVRRGRQNRWWRELSIAAYAFAIMMYEQTALFFLLHPIIAYFEDRGNGIIGDVWRWLFRVVLDSLWFPVILAGYLFVLRILFAAEDHLSLSPLRLVEQLASGVSTVFAPAAFAGLVDSASRALPALVTVGAFIFVLLAVLSVKSSYDSTRTSNDADSFMYLAVLGAGMIGAILLAIAPTQWVIPEHPRLIYPAALGYAYLLVGAFGWLMLRIPVARFALAAVVALLVGAGVARLIVLQDEFSAQNAARQRALTAIRQSVPGLNDEAYLLLYSDANPTTDLWLFAQDNRFPLMFDRLFNTEGLYADTLYFDLDESLAPPDDVPGSDYNGQFIVVEPEGIYSPLRPYEPINPARLVIMYYDSATGEAEIVNELPTDVIERANIVQRTEILWRTNPDMLTP